jgi:radical SAM protein with 4Fe4S-binding SPASM domain
MCNIWRLNRKKEELALDEIIRFLSDPLFSDLVELDLTGGEPLLRRDLPELIREVAELRKSHFKKLKTLALATNGLLPNYILRSVKKILSAINGKFDLAIVCSLDGIGAKHDLVRGTPHAYQRVRETIDNLKDLCAGALPFWLGIKTTILPVNWDQIPDLICFARDNGLFHILSPVLFTPERFRNIAAQNRLSLFPDYRQKLIDLYRSDDFKDLYYSHVVVETLERGHRTVPCSAALDHFFVEGDGRVYPCPMINFPLGSIQTHTLESILVSNPRRDMAAKAGQHETCRQCLEPGCIRFSQTCEGLTFLKFVLKGNRKRRLEHAFRDEGLSKYF